MAAREEPGARAGARPEALAGAGRGAGPSRLRLARMAARLSQDQLAAEAGVTRQAVAGIEAGNFDPSLKVALRLAAALGSPVEELFGSASPGVSSTPGEKAWLAEPPVPGRLTGQLSGEHSGTLSGGSHGDPIRLALSATGEGLAAFSLTGDACAAGGFRPASGVAVEQGPSPEAGTPAAGPRTRARRPPAGPGAGGEAGAAGPGGPELTVRMIAPRAPTLAVAGCDPALPLLSGPLGALDPPVGLFWWPCSSARALELLSLGAVHAAGLHLRSGRDGSYNTPLARQVFAGEGAEVIGFASWREGLVLGHALGGRVETLADAARAGARIVNREQGSEARQVLDRERRRARIPVASLQGYDVTLTGHLPVASAIAAGLAELGVTSEPAALAYGLDFVPLATERYDLVVRREQLGTPEVRSLLAVLGSSALHAQLDAIAGYDASMCGTVVDAF